MYELYENVKRLDFFVSIIVFMYCQILEHMRICMSFTIFNMCFIFINLDRDKKNFSSGEWFGLWTSWFLFILKNRCCSHCVSITFNISFFLMLQLRLQFVYQFHFQNIVETLAYFRNEMKKSISTPLTILLYKIKNNNVSTDQL